MSQFLPFDQVFELQDYTHLLLLFVLIITDSLPAQTDVDEGHDWDIFTINEGLLLLFTPVSFYLMISDNV